jgi:arylsulfatase
MFRNSGIAGLLLAATNLAYAGGPDHSDKSPMNVVLLIADDLRWNSLGCAGNTVVITPEIDRLAQEGIRFSNAHVTTSVCMVSRASILTGQYMSRHGITGFLQPLSDDAIANTYPALMRNAGYYTGYVGKYGVGNIKTGQFDFAMEYEGKHWIPDDKGDSVHVTQKNLNDALGFLKQRPPGRPFCLTVGFFATHAEDNHPDQYRYQPESEPLFRNVVIPVPETAAPEYLKMLPPFISSEENEGRRRWHWRFDTPEKYQRYMKAYYRMLAELDEAVGEIIDELKKEGVYENTMIIFMGDNGYFQGEHQLADKWYPYEESIRIPLVVYDPRIPVRMRGTANDGLLLNIDIAPGIIAAAGIAAPAEMQGSDFSALYYDKKTPWRTDYFYEHPVVIDVKRIPSSKAIVTRDMKYILWPDYQVEEFFDLKKDPLEKANRSTDPAYTGKIESLRERFRILEATAK